jgi:hypothetical protein
MNSKTALEEIEHEPLYRVSREGYDDNDASIYTTSINHRQKTLRSRVIPIIALFLIVTLTLICFGLYARLHDLNRKLQQIQKNDTCSFPTDVQDAVRYIGYEERVFTGAIKFNQTRGGIGAYQDIPKGEPRYFGDPEVHPEIDENWKGLLSSEFEPWILRSHPFVVTDQLAKR